MNRGRARKLGRCQWSRKSNFQRKSSLADKNICVGSPLVRFSEGVATSAAPIFTPRSAPPQPDSFVPAAIVKLRRVRRGVVRHRCGRFISLVEAFASCGPCPLPGHASFVRRSLMARVAKSAAFGLDSVYRSGAPEGIRTPDLCLRRVTQATLLNISQGCPAFLQA